MVEKAADLIKNPFVLEFLGLEEKPAYSENELESAIIDRLEIFLLELGKGFLFEARQKRFAFDNDLITQKKLSNRIGISPRNIRKNMDVLKSKGLLKRIGPRKGGRWKVILPQNGSSQMEEK